MDNVKETQKYKDMEKTDFKYYTTLYSIEEKLSKEDIEDDIIPECLNFDIAISGHAEIQRQARNKNRKELVNITHKDIYGMIERYGHRLYNVKNHGEFSVIDSKLGIGIVCVVHQKFPNNLIVVKTVLNNENIYITRGTETLNMVNGKTTKGFKKVVKK